MKKLLVILIITGFLTGCYDDFRLDNDFTAVAFSRADGGSNIEGVLHRTVVKDEGLRLDVGINLTGVIENDKERWADFVIDPSLVDATMQSNGYMLMPENYYSLSNDSRFIIKSGSILGKVTVELDSVNFLSDPDAVNHVYAIPFRLTETSEDSINAELYTKLVVIKYMNHFEGYYDQSGTIESHDAGGTLISSDPVDNVIEMYTVSLDTVVTNGMLNQTGAAFQMLINVNPDNTVKIGNTASSAANVIETTGACNFDHATSTFTLNYKVTASDDTYKIASVQLVWRNRIRDGINEWRRD